MSVLQGSVYVAELVADSDLSAATITCSVTAPDGTVSTVSGASITVAGTVASTPVTATQPGTYMLVWSSTGTVVGSQLDQFTCYAPEVDLISLPDLKEELRIVATNATYDTKIRRWMKAATNIVENVTGPIRPRTVTDVFDGGRQVIVLNDFWVQSITSITEHWGNTSYVLTEQPLGFATSSYGFTWDRDSNLITRRDASGYATFFAPGANSVVAVYRAGLAVVPDDIQIAAVDFVRHQYAKARQDRVPGYGGQQGDESSMVGNWSVPNSMMELLEPHRRMPGIA